MISTEPAILARMHFLRCHTPKKRFGISASRDRGRRTGCPAQVRGKQARSKACSWKATAMPQTPAKPLFT